MGGMGRRETRFNHSLGCSTGLESSTDTRSSAFAGEETLALFAKATENHPKNENVAIEAFLHYVRVGERRSARQVSFPRRVPLLRRLTVLLLGADQHAHAAQLQE
jgi:hypothetical protein